MDLEGTASSPTVLSEFRGQMDELTMLIRHARVPNALLFTGSRGSGRKDAATTLAKALNCINNAGRSCGFPCNWCRSCIKIDAAMHPDIITLAPEKNTIKIDRIRELCGSIAGKPHEAQMRMVVIIDAHAMNQEAANSLLKSLEEPPERTFFVLIAPDLNLLLPTIISRCRHIRFKPLSCSVIADKLAQGWAVPLWMAEIAAKTSAGNMEKAMMFVNVVQKIKTEKSTSAPHSKNMGNKRGKKSADPAESMDWIKRRHWLLSRMFLLLKPDQNSSSAATSAMMLAEKLSRESCTLDDSFLLIKLWFRDMALIRYGQDIPSAGPGTFFVNGNQPLHGKGPQHAGNLLINTDFSEILHYLAHVLPKPFSLQSLDAVHRAEMKLQSNASVRLILEHFFLSLLSDSV